MNESRIPHPLGTSTKAAAAWLATLHKRSMLFCLDDDPREIVLISDGSRMFSDREAEKVSSILDILFLKLDDKLHDLAFETLSRTFHTKAERRAFKTMYG